MVNLREATPPKDLKPQWDDQEERYEKTFRALLVRMKNKDVKSTQIIKTTWLDARINQDGTWHVRSDQMGATDQTADYKDALKAYLRSKDLTEGEFGLFLDSEKPQPTERIIELGEDFISFIENLEQ